MKVKMKNIFKGLDELLYSDIKPEINEVLSELIKVLSKLETECFYFPYLTGKEVPEQEKKIAKQQIELLRKMLNEIYKKSFDVIFPDDYTENHLILGNYLYVKSPASKEMFVISVDLLWVVFRQFYDDHGLIIRIDLNEDSDQVTEVEDKHSNDENKGK